MLGLTLRVNSKRPNHKFIIFYAVFKEHGGDEEIRTPDPLLARQVLSQLSYAPMKRYVIKMVGLSGLEPPTSRLSGVRSNQLSYRPTYER